MRIDINGTRIFFDVEGAKYVPDGPRMRERPTLVVLHGGPGWDSSNNKPVFSAFTEWMQVVHVDHRGHGRSDGWDRKDTWTLEQWGRDVRDFCDALEIEKPAVIGTSFGGMVAQSYGMQFPDHPGKLILSSTTAKLRLDRIAAVFARLLGQDVGGKAYQALTTGDPELVAWYMDVCLPEYSTVPLSADHRARIRYNNDLLMNFTGPGGEGQSFNFLPDLHRVKAPTLVATGVDDPITPADDSRDIARAIGAENAQLFILENCRHGIVAERPEGFELVRRFVLGEPLNLVPEAVEDRVS